MNDQSKSALESATEALSEAKSKVEQSLVDPTQDAIKVRVLNNLNKDISYLNSLTSGTVVESTASVRRVPLTHILGRPVASGATQASNQQQSAAVVQQPAAGKSPEEIAADELVKNVEELLPQFSTLEADKILDGYDELVIRGVGKRAGLPVTETSPKKIDIKFVENVKAKLKEKEGLSNQ